MVLLLDPPEMVAFVEATHFEEYGAPHREA